MTRQPDIPLTELTLHEARTRLKRLLTPVDICEDRSLANAHGAILGQDVISAINVPPAHTAAVDGYACRHADLMASPDRCLPISGKAHAGHPLAHPFTPDTTIYITTGTPMPVAVNPDHNPDTIAMQEHCQISERDGTTWVTFPDHIKPMQNFRPAGENIKAGDKALTKGCRLGSAEIGLAAAIGHNRLACYPRLVIGILSTGEELKDVMTESPDHEPDQGYIYDSNRPMLNSLLINDGYECHDGGMIRDDRNKISMAMRDLLSDCDAIIITGGSSGGTEDFARAAITDCGGTVDFAGIRIKPGRPFAAGTIAHRPVFCIPGNPVAVYVTYQLLVSDALRVLAGGMARPSPRFPVTCGFDVKHKPGRTDFIRATLTMPDAGLPVAMPHGRFGAGVLTSITGADGLLEISAESGNMKEGDICHFIPFREAL
ncbi:MAG: molybdopterin molybdotransferase MoeA [Candidatus Puniceispirillales bacterium]